VDQTQSELQKSRESLLQAEKMALVGKLAAGMAHSIRNPFTSVKMRLFSLNRSLEFTDTQKEDFDVISQEIRHIDTIVQNFLEFSRPPKLKIQSISPSIVVDQAIVLLKHRLKSYDVEVTIERERNLPEIDADPEQLKEVLVNLVVNACEAMEKGGSIVIREQEAMTPSKDRLSVIRVSDNGPGIPESMRDKVLQPFFTTKEEGTGLGLSIAVRILAEHHGRMDIESNQGGGTTFVITLPHKEPSDEHDSDY
jgi:signal transduction histidine kinase